MINNLNIMLPEIFLSLSIFSILMLGVFIKESFNVIFNLTSIIIIITISIIISIFIGLGMVFMVDWIKTNDYRIDLIKRNYFN